MKKLILMRHGHAAPVQSSQTDNSRSLDTTGIHQATVITKKLIAENIFPDFIITSRALRAVQTAEIILNTMNLDLEPHTYAELYSAAPGKYSEIFRAVPDIYESVMIVAHNPGIESVASSLLTRRIHMRASDLFYAELSIERWSDFSLTSPVQNSRVIKASA